MLCGRVLGALRSEELLNESIGAGYIRPELATRPSGGRGAGAEDRCGAASSAPAEPEAVATIAAAAAEFPVFLTRELDVLRLMARTNSILDDRTYREYVDTADTRSLPGEVVKVLVKPGDKVKSGDGLVILSSMKMENTIEAFEDGVVEEVFVEPKKFVEAETLLIKISKS